MREAGVALQTFSRHFGTKDQLLAVIGEGLDDGARARFIVSTHWHLRRSFPNEVADAMRPFAGLILTEINAAVEDGQLAASFAEPRAGRLARPHSDRHVASTPPTHVGTSGPGSSRSSTIHV